jgi:hypothetical protein
MQMMAQAARWRLGMLLGGDEGAQIAADAARALAGEGMRDPESASRILVLGQR